MSLVFAGLAAGWALWGQRLWASGPARREDCPGWGDVVPEEQGSIYSGGLTIHEAEEYLAAQGYADQELAEVMEFEANFYAIAREPDSGIGAMELLVDRDTGAVVPRSPP